MNENKLNSIPVDFSIAPNQTAEDPQCQIEHIDMDGLNKRFVERMEEYDHRLNND